MKNPKILISLLNWNNPKSTIDTLSSLQHLVYDNYEIIVIDNNSTDNSLDEFSNSLFNFKVIVNDKNLGYAGGHKSVLTYFFQNNFNLLWLINNDIVVHPDSLMHLVKSYLLNGVGLYGSLILSTNGLISFSGGNELKDDFIDYYNSNNYYNHSYEKHKYELLEKKVGILHGSSLLIPSEVIKAYGFIDDRFFLYGEEVDYCLRMLRKGIYSYFVPKSIIWHSESKTTKMTRGLELITSYYMTRNSLFYNNNFSFPASSRHSVILKYGGYFTFFSILLRLQISKFLNYNSSKYIHKYYEYLAVFHFLINKKGPYLDPDKFINYKISN